MHLQRYGQLGSGDTGELSHSPQLLDRRGFALSAHSQEQLLVKRFVHVSNETRRPAETQPLCTYVLYRERCMK